MTFWPKSAHVKFLEADRERLLVENRALVDALLKANGLPAVLTPRSADSVKPPQMKPRWLPSQWRAAIERNAEKRFAERVEREKKEQEREKISA